jgi:PAS domain S-box-containing protein
MEAGRHETHFRLMAKNLAEMVLAYDMERRLTFANAAVESLTGYSVDELEHSQFICWVHPEDRGRMMEYWERLFDGRAFHEEQYRMLTRDGRMKWVAASWGPILDDSGRQVGVQGRERDITERRMAEETLRQSEQRLRVSEERYRSLFESSPFPMWEEDFSDVKVFLDELRSGGVANIGEYLSANRDELLECLRRVKVLDVNQAAREFYGATSKSELLNDFPKIFDDAAYGIFLEEIEVLAAGSQVFQTEFPTRTLSGESRTVSMIVSVVASPSNDWSRLIVSFFDITDRKQLEEQLLQSQKLESLGRLAGGIAHDFNNLLTVINGYSDLLLHSIDGENPAYSGLEQIRNAGARAADLTQQLLAFSRKQVTQLRAMNLNGLIEESLPMLRRLVGEDIRLDIALAADLGTVKADPGQMHQVIMNLVANARDAMPDGGKVTIETCNVDAPAPPLGRKASSTPRPHVLMRVADTGIGMDAQTKDRLFEPFFTTKRSTKGTGLGLSTVFGIVTQTGGRVLVSSDPGCGASFSVFLPRIAGMEAPAARSAFEAGAIKGEGVILVAEDQDEVRMLTCMVLRSAGYQVLEAGDGLEAMLVAEQFGQPIRVLLTDVIMPGMNGKELAMQLGRLQPDLKVIFMSGYTGRIMNEGSAIDSSAVFLQKPFVPARLLETVERTLR